jgi:protein-S-isoprenylcysteine O-methyltransferase Ste14
METEAIEKLYLGAVLIFFILAFAIRNIKTYLATGTSIRGKSKKLTASLLLSTFIYVILGVEISLDRPVWVHELNILGQAIIRFAGYTVVMIGFVLGILALVAMRNSWRVGIRHDQHTELITSGIYRFSRNPYFLSYDILILGFVLLFPSPLLYVPYALLVVVFHEMIKEEERYLEKEHGDKYLDYKRTVGRYLI